MSREHGKAHPAISAVSAISAGVAAGKVSAHDVADLALRRAAAAEEGHEALNAILAVDEHGARDAAARIDKLDPAARAAMPLVACTTRPPAKSSTPSRASQPPLPHTQWQTGL